MQDDGMLGHTDMIMATGGNWAGRWHNVVPPSGYRITPSGAKERRWSHEDVRIVNVLQLMDDAGVLGKEGRKRKIAVDIISTQPADMDDVNCAILCTEKMISLEMRKPWR